MLTAAQNYIENLGQEYLFLFPWNSNCLPSSKPILELDFININEKQEVTVDITYSKGDGTSNNTRLVIPSKNVTTVSFNEQNFFYSSINVK